MNVYLDASVLVPLVIQEVWTERAEALFGPRKDAIIVSDFAAAEFSAVIARATRDGTLDRRSAQAIYEAFDGWSAGSARRAVTEARDIAEAERLIRRLDLKLRAPDPVHLAVAMRLGLELATFDRRLAEAAGALGLPVAPI